MSIPHRSSLRVEPECPITVAIEDELGSLVASGAVADISRKGVCIWTDAPLSVGATCHFRINSGLPEVHTLAGKVVWARADPSWPVKSARYCGVAWLDAERAHRVLPRLLHLQSP